jgi:hypothetical protein
VLVSFRMIYGMADFDMFIEYEADGFEFGVRVNSTANNIDHITERYNAINRNNKVSFVGKSVLHARYLQRYKHGILPVIYPISKDHIEDSFFHPDKVIKVDFALHATMYFYDSGSIIQWKIGGDLPYWLEQDVLIHLAALKPQIIGTAEHYLPQLRQAAKAEVTANAIRRANMMRDNADDILSFLELSCRSM